MLGQKASETARLLKAGLAAIRQEQAGLDAEAQRIEAEQRRLDGAKPASRSACGSPSGPGRAGVGPNPARAIDGRTRAVAGVESAPGQLQGECHAVIQAGTQAIDALKAQDQGEVQRLERLEQRIALRLAQSATAGKCCRTSVDNASQCWRVCKPCGMPSAVCPWPSGYCRCVRLRSGHGANRSNA